MTNIVLVVYATAECLYVYHSSTLETLDLKMMLLDILKIIVELLHVEFSLSHK